MIAKRLRRELLRVAVDVGSPGVKSVSISIYVSVFFFSHFIICSVLKWCIPSENIATVAAVATPGNMSSEGITTFIDINNLQKAIGSIQSITILSVVSYKILMIVLIRAIDQSTTLFGMDQRPHSTVKNFAFF